MSVQPHPAHTHPVVAPAAPAAPSPSGHAFATAKLLLVATCEAWIADDGFRLAAALAYYALFSLAPLVLIAAAIAGSILNQQHVRFLLADRLYEVLGTAALPVVRGILQHIPDRRLGTLSGALGIAFMLIGASAVFVELQDAFDLIWRTPTPRLRFLRLVRERLHSFVLVLFAAMLLLVSAVLTTGVVAASSLAVAWFGLSEPALHVGGVFLSFLVAAMLFAVLFRLVPRSSVAWGDVWVAAAVTALLFEVGKFLIALYLGTSTVISLYGAAASLVLLLAWIYYSAVVVYFGAEFAHVYANHRANALHRDVGFKP